MKKTIIIVTAIALAAIFSLGVFLLFQSGESYYYTQIKNSEYEINKNAGQGGVIDFTGGMKYLYTLKCYNESGGEKTFTFGTTRELKEDAFLKLTTKAVQGVVYWEEVQYKDMPNVVREKYDGE